MHKFDNMRLDSENGWITCPGIKQGSWGQKDHEYFLVFSVFLVRPYTKWRMLSPLPWEQWRTQKMRARLTCTTIHVASST